MGWVVPQRGAEELTAHKKRNMKREKWGETLIEFEEGSGNSFGRLSAYSSIVEGCKDASIAQIVAKGIGAPAEAKFNEIRGVSLFM